MTCCVMLVAASVAIATAPSVMADGRPAVIVDERDVVREEPAPHGAIGSSTAYRISDAAPGRSMEFRKRVLHVGAAIGAHELSHDEVYYVLDGEGEVHSDGRAARLGPGMAAYLYRGATVGIRQLGARPLTIIVSYPLPVAADLAPAPAAPKPAH
jgi:mannose-6-phosphate isomerase-like protein (cupin superfamily)